MADKTPAAPAPTPDPATTVAEYPGQTLGIVGLVLAFVLPLVGIVLGVVAWNWSKKAGIANTPAKVAVVVGIALLVAGLIVYLVWFSVVGPYMFGGWGNGWGMMGY